ncbi:MAG: hypothetical protein VW808_03505, partial [Schleiferiaceae bacterium]
MLLIILVAFVLTGTFSLYHFRSENKQYHYDRLARKENAMVNHLDYITKEFQGKNLSEAQWRELLSDKVSEVSSVHQLDMGVYSKYGNLLSGSLLYSNDPKVFPPTVYLEEAAAPGEEVPLKIKERP